MKYQIKFYNVTEAQQDTFIEVYKAIPYDLVDAFRKVATTVNCDVVVIADKYITGLTVVGK